MIQTPDDMSCAEFQARLADFIGSGEDVAHHSHIRQCDHCRILFSDIQTIATTARELFPVVEPPEEVWENIELAIKDAGPGE